MKKLHILFFLTSLSLSVSTYADLSDSCVLQACEKKHETDINILLPDLARMQFDADVNLVENQEVVIDQQIIKVNKLSTSPNSSLLFDLNNDFEYYIVIINHLVVNSVSTKNPELKLGWYVGDESEFWKKLKGADGDHAPERNASSRDKNGLDGKSGEHGKTKHSPNIFIFVNRFSVQEGNYLDVDMDVKLVGLHGGAGGNGGNGSKGLDGNRGRGAFDGWLKCVEGKRGGRGGAPGKGGRGGNTGCNGNGADFFVYYSDNNELAYVLNSSRVDVDGGIYYEGRFAGAPGDPGLPGKGGPGGRRDGNCDGGKRGHDGWPGTADTQYQNWNNGPGLEALRPGVDGNYDFYIADKVIQQVFLDPAQP